jgi:hypothetical protein
MRVGLAWSGSPAQKDNNKRSITLNQLAPLARVRGVRYFSLQKGPAGQQANHPPAGMDLLDHTDNLTTMAETAALISNLDLVITVDTSIAHLAGAMGKRTWVLLAFVPAWQWLVDRDDSPWYPTAELFRQPAMGDWASVIDRVADRLHQEASNRNSA